MIIMYLDHDPKTCAEYHTDSDIKKLPDDYCQLLSNAHRLCDGYFRVVHKNGKKYKEWMLKDTRLDRNLLKVTNSKHPFTNWVMDCEANYLFLVDLLHECFKEYSKRSGKDHRYLYLMEYFERPPLNISRGTHFYKPPIKVPIYCEINGSILESYRNIYRSNPKFCSWKTQTPRWF